ncbi:uncharacterized protein LOC103522534, partial [Diaphorina citri]|uniref:Uncharacterized protein LOC103522534 n=1 Tax=Diaphorina citri TaxID=121845 RepID=A0A1S3DQ79_DIACI
MDEDLDSMSMDSDLANDNNAHNDSGDNNSVQEGGDVVDMVIIRDDPDLSEFRLVTTDNEPDGTESNETVADNGDESDNGEEVPFDIQLPYQHLVSFVSYPPTCCAKVPDDPVQLSYWILINFPMSDSIRVEMLSLNNALHRLHRLIDYFKN